MADERDDVDVQRELGIPPALAAAAAFEGLPRVLSPVISDAPHGLAKALMTGVPIEAATGTPLGRLSEFTRAEAKAIAAYAKRQGVTVPIIAAGPGFESGYFMDRPGMLRRLLMRVAGEPVGDVVPHIGLSRSSVPQALHEIAHASPIASSHDLRRALQSMGKTLGTGSVIGHLVRGGIAATTVAAPEKDSGLHKFLFDNAPALVAATTVPELAEEARASIKALRGSRASGISTVRALAELAPSFGTYLAAAAAPVFATILAKRLVAALRDAAAQKRDARTAELEAKVASTAPGGVVKAPGILRSSASSAWRMGVNPPKPKTIGPGAVGTPAKGRAPAPPPSKTSFYKDLLQSLYTPGRGSRLATPSG
jgi:hypothetical protein